jgi:hypothetical protein
MTSKIVGSPFCKKGGCSSCDGASKKRCDTNLDPSLSLSTPKIWGPCYDAFEKVCAPVLTHFAKCEPLIVSSVPMSPSCVRAQAHERTGLTLPNLFVRLICLWQQSKGGFDAWRAAARMLGLPKATDAELREALGAGFPRHPLQVGLLRGGIANRAERVV